MADTSHRTSATKFQRSKSKSPKSASKSVLPPNVSAKRSNSTKGSSRSRSGSRGRTPAETKPQIGILGKTKISSVLRDELSRLTRLAAIEGDENNNYLEDIENYGTQTIKLEVCPRYRILEMNGQPASPKSPSLGNSIPEHNDTLIVSSKIPSRIFVRSTEAKLKPSDLTASYYRCVISNDEESDKSRLSRQSKPKVNDKGASGFQSTSTLTTVSLLNVPPEQDEGSRLGMEYIAEVTELMKQFVPGDLDAQIVSGAYQLGSQVINAGWKVASSLMPDESDLDHEADLIKVNGYEIRSCGRGILIQSIYINSDRHAEIPPTMDRRTLDPLARLRLWIQLRRESTPHAGLHGYSDDFEIEPQVSVTETKWTMNYGDSNILTIAVPAGVCTSHISRTTYPDGSLIIQTP